MYLILPCRGSDLVIFFLMGAYHVDLRAAYLGAYPGVGAYHSTGKNSYLGAYPGVGACPGDYGNIITYMYMHTPCLSSVPVIWKVVVGATCTHVSVDRTQLQ